MVDDLCSRWMKQLDCSKRHNRIVKSAGLIVGNKSAFSIIIFTYRESEQHREIFRRNYESEVTIGDRA